jgi:sortase A
MSGRRHGVRAVLHFIASVLITSGILMLADAGLTLAWQEPVSAFLAQQQQNALGDELDKAAQDFSSQHGLVPISGLDSRRDLARAATEWRGRLKTGHPMGRIVLPTLGRHYVVVQGTDTASLRKGPGHYPKTNVPGEGGTIAIAGHRTTYLAPFRTVNKLKPGQEIDLEMPYGRFVYQVFQKRIVKPSDVGVLRSVPKDRRLVLTACHPLYSAAQRIVVFARLVNSEARGAAAAVT